MQETLTFEAMPQAILELMHKVDSLRADIGELKRHCQVPTLFKRRNEISRRDLSRNHSHNRVVADDI